MDDDISCIHGRRVHCLQMASLLELSEAVSTHGYSLDDHFNFSTRDQLSVQFLDINTLENSYFAQYSFLSSLRLFFCGITTMRLNPFEGLSGLRTLYLIGLNVIEFDMAVLVDVPHLRQLAITDGRKPITRMQSLRSSDGRLQLKDLQEMDLSGNGIAFIEIGLFDQAPNLKVLNLADNELEYLPTKPFAANNALVDINLSRNRLKSLQPDTFIYAQPFATIRLRRNSLSCQTETLQAIMCAIQKPRHVYVDWNLTASDMSAGVELLTEACEAYKQYLRQMAEAAIIMRSGPEKSSATSFRLSTTAMQTLLSLRTLLSAVFAIASSRRQTGE